MRVLFPVVALLILSTSPVLAQQESTLSKLDISAQANVTANPDIANVSAGVVTVAKTAAQAMQDNANKMSAVFAALKKAGVVDKDVQTSGISLNPQYNYQNNLPPTIINYQASNTVNIKVRDLKNIGPVLDALIAQGANQLNGPTFAIENSDALMDQARAEAVKKAMARAQIYATAAGVKIKRILAMSESGGYTPPMPMMARAMAMKAEASDASTPVATGEVGLSVSVNVTFEIE